MQVFYFKRTRASQKALVRKLRSIGLPRRAAKEAGHDFREGYFHIVEYSMGDERAVRVINTAIKY